MAFIPIATPKPARDLPSGGDWLHEIKFDGFRLQVHVRPDGTRRGAPAAVLYSRHGETHLAVRFPAIVRAAAALAASGAVLDGELIACRDDGMPDFYKLLRGRPDNVCVMCFDLLALDGEDLRQRPLEERRRLLDRVTAGSPMFMMCDAFDDGDALLAEAERIGLEGVVAKKRAGIYVAGDRCGWLKVKTQAWKAANADRWELFDKG